ncbi:hypothetical protein JTB14_019735 [Gonioctena quinquepunctata]|nr:hypothetical protein JTB14_019735 [Gonioctena quinquepunctata]
MHKNRCQTNNKTDDSLLRNEQNHKDDIALDDIGVLSEALHVLNNNEENESDLSTKQHKDKECEESVAGLLNKWDVPELEEHFRSKVTERKEFANLGSGFYFSANKVDLKSLKYARYHQLPDLLQNIPWGIEVKFEHNLFEWQKSIFDLKSVLNKYNEGKSILKLIDLNIKALEVLLIKELPEAQQQILVDKIVDYFIQNDKKISVSLARIITDQILCLFLDEPREYYFAPQTNESPKGKLLAKYYNHMRKLKSIGLIEAPLVTKRKLQDSEPSDLLGPEEDAIGKKERLKYMQEYERWDEVKLLWKKCQNFRRKLLVEDESTNIINILTEWPCYKHPMGSTLIDLDFENIYPKATNIFEK